MVIYRYKMCTCHDNTAIVSCAKLHSDHFVTPWMSTEWNLLRIWITMEKSFVKWARGPIMAYHDDVIKWKHFPRYWPFVRGIHRSPVNFPHKGQWHGALMFSLICVWINDWVNNREAGDLRRYRADYDIIVMTWLDQNLTPPATCHVLIFSVKRAFELKVIWTNIQPSMPQSLRGAHITTDNSSEIRLRLTRHIFPLAQGPFLLIDKSFQNWYGSFHKSLEGILDGNWCYGRMRFWNISVSDGLLEYYVKVGCSGDQIRRAINGLCLAVSF